MHEPVVPLLQDLGQTMQQVVTEVCGFVTIVAGTFLLHATRDMDTTLADLASLTKARHTGGPWSPADSHVDQRLPMLSSTAPTHRGNTNSARNATKKSDVSVEL